MISYIPLRSLCDKSPATIREGREHTHTHANIFLFLDVERSEEMKEIERQTKQVDVID